LTDGKTADSTGVAFYAVLVGIGLRGEAIGTAGDQPFDFGAEGGLFKRNGIGGRHRAGENEAALSRLWTLDLELWTFFPPRFPLLKLVMDLAI
jgi:hypothetical protein